MKCRGGMETRKSWLKILFYVPRVMKTKFPQSVMVFGCNSSEGDEMPPHVFPQGLRLNSNGYVELLCTVVKPWVGRAAARQPYIWQQNSTPCHTADKSRKSLCGNFHNFTSPNVWPPSNLDCNPMNSYV